MSTNDSQHRKGTNKSNGYEELKYLEHNVHSAGFQVDCKKGGIEQRVLTSLSSQVIFMTERKKEYKLH